MNDLIAWFKEAGGFEQGTKAPHKWVLQAEQELRIQAAALAEAQAALGSSVVAMKAARGVIVSKQEHAMLTKAIDEARAALEAKTPANG